MNVARFCSKSQSLACLSHYEAIMVCSARLRIMILLYSTGIHRNLGPKGVHNMIHDAHSNTAIPPKTYQVVACTARHGNLIQKNWPVEIPKGRIYIGPVESSVFVRNCSSCSCLVANDCDGKMMKDVARPKQWSLCCVEIDAKCGNVEGSANVIKTHKHNWTYWVRVKVQYSVEF